MNDADLEAMEMRLPLHMDANPANVMVTETMQREFVIFKVASVSAKITLKA